MLLREMFSEHGIPKVLYSDNSLQYVNAQFANFCISWGITHETSCLHYPQSNGFAEACMKSVKHAVVWAKYSSADPQLALLALWATPFNKTLTQNNHSSQDPQQQSIIHTCPWADWHTLWSHQITGWQTQQNTCATVCWSTSCNVWHPQKDMDSCYCDTCPITEQLSSMHQQWFHILLHAETPSWMQCQSSWHCPKWHNCHTTGSDKRPLLSGTACSAPTSTVHASHTHCTWNTGNPEEPGPSCSCHTSCSKECPRHQHLWHPMPHLCNHEDLAMPTWHPDAWSRKSKNYWPRLSMDLVIVMCHHIHPQSIVVVKLQCIIFSEKGMSYVFHIHV